MNQFTCYFRSTHVSAGVSAAMSSYFGSPEFATRSQFNGADGSRDATQVQLYMLAGIALDPKEVDTTTAMLTEGTVCLQFFGVSNPVPYFDVVVGSEDHKALMAAVSANIQSKMFNAAERHLSWRAPKKTQARSNHREAVRRAMSESLVWPNSKECSEAVYRELYSANLNTLNSLESAVRNRRSTRLEKLVAAATPAANKGWYDLLENIALKVFSPVH